MSAQACGRLCALSVECPLAAPSARHSKAGRGPHAAACHTLLHTWCCLHSGIRPPIQASPHACPPAEPAGTARAWSTSGACPARRPRPRCKSTARCATRHGGTSDPSSRASSSMAAHASRHPSPPGALSPAPHPTPTPPPTPCAPAPRPMPCLFLTRRPCWGLCQWRRLHCSWGCACGTQPTQPPGWPAWATLRTCTLTGEPRPGPA